MIIPVILEKDFDEIVKRVEGIESQVGMIQIDFCDGKAVNGKTFLDIKRLNEIHTSVFFDIDLMVENPIPYVREHLTKGAKICAQVENEKYVEKFIKEAKKQGYIVGLSIKYETPLEKLDKYLDQIKFVQFFGIEPGGQGREFIHDVVHKIKKFRKDHPHIKVQVDGGMDKNNILELTQAGVDDLIIGSAIFGSGNYVTNYLQLKDLPMNTISTLSIVKKIAFLGGADWKEDSDVYKDVFEIAKVLAKSGYEILNGGGPGVMRAATKGAHAGGAKVLAITYHPNKKKMHFEGVDPENDFDEEVVTFDYFDRTKVLLQNSDLHIVFSGATGTISEFGMTWASSRIHEGNNKPIIVYGKFWNDLLDCIEKNLNLRPGERSLLKVCTTPKEVLEYIKEVSM